MLKFYLFSRKFFLYIFSSFCCIEYLICFLNQFWFIFDKIRTISLWVRWFRCCCSVRIISWRIRPWMWRAWWCSCISITQKMLWNINFFKMYQLSVNHFTINLHHSNMICWWGRNGLWKYYNKLLSWKQNKDLWIYHW